LDEYVHQLEAQLRDQKENFNKKFNELELRESSASTNRTTFLWFFALCMVALLINADTIQKCFTYLRSGINSNSTAINSNSTAINSNSLAIKANERNATTLVQRYEAELDRADDVAERHAQVQDVVAAALVDHRRKLDILAMEIQR
jgi:hypothetical protein